MTLRTVIAGGIAAAALLSGCGGGSSSPPSRDSASRNTDVRAAFLAVSRCMREHGYPRFPDPVQNPEGDWTFPDSGQNPRQTPAACDQIARTAKTRGAGGKGRHSSTADIALARGFARCMREHGVADFPDPDETGGFRMPARLRPPNGAAILRAPEQACRQYIPKKGVRVQGGP
jgi:hypothetical protein